MRFAFILFAAVPLVLAGRALGHFRDWLALRAWLALPEGARVEPFPPLTDPMDPRLSLWEATGLAWARFVSSGLLAAASCCFALAGCLAFGWALGYW